VDYSEIIKSIEYINPLGRVPVFCATIGKKRERGVGSTPELEAVADIQRVIYNLCSELEQSIRINSHPSLVKTADTQAAAGAGSIINMPENLPGDLKPYLLQPSTSTVDGILAAIKYNVEAIDRITNLGSVRGQKTMSGVAMETEQQTLNAKLNNMAAGLERIEYKIWRLFFEWNQVEMPDDFSVEYIKEFNIRDKDREIARLQTGMQLVSNPLYQAEAQKQIVGLTLDEDEVIETIQQSIFAADPDGAARGAMMATEPHPFIGEEPAQQVDHINSMLAEGYTNAEILALHPEIEIELVDELRHAFEGT
jgi:2-oxo-4-hydroxy-4-carboxy--5-ureidoimidazoline (OHCU) decarboxylase